MSILTKTTDFIAILKYRTTDEGGRKTPAFNSYRPQIRFPFSEMLTSGQQTLFKQMRLIRILAIVTLASCGPKNQEVISVNTNDDKLVFDEYVATLKKIDIPINLTNSLSTDGNVYEYGKFEKFKTIWSDKPFGILFLAGDKTVTADLQIGSGYGLALVVYDNAGHKLDSLYPLRKTDSDIDFETTEEVYIDKGKKIIVSSLTEKWQLSADNSRAENTKTISRDTVIYVLGQDGRFKEIKE